MTPLYFGLLIFWLFLCVALVHDFVMCLDTKYSVFFAILSLCLVSLMIWGIELQCLVNESLKWRSQFANAIVV